MKEAKGKKKIAKVMTEMKEGKLHSGSKKGPIVGGQKQAVAIALSEARKVGSSQWEALTDNGREQTGRDVLQWSMEASELGAGEVLITSVDREGTRSGFDVDLVAAIANHVECPVVASGGMGSVQDFVNLASSVDIGGIAAADVLHFGRVSVREIRENAFRSGVGVRLDV